MSAPDSATWGEPQSFDDALDDANDDILSWGASRAPADMQDIFAALSIKNEDDRPSKLDYMQNRRLFLGNDDNAYRQQMILYCRQAGCKRHSDFFRVAQTFTLPGQFGRFLGNDYKQVNATIARLVKETERGEADGDDKPEGKGKNGGRTQDGMALAFVERHQDKLRFCHHTSKWFMWNGTIWQKQETQLAFHYARNICRDFAGKKLTKAADAASVERFARADPSIAVTSEIWDRDKFLLGTPAGTVDLHTGELRPSRREDFITKSTAVAPSATANCPMWLGLISKITCGDKALADYLQRYFGYCLTGDTREQSIMFCWGKGGNGKTVTLKTLKALMGDYAKTAPMDTFTEGRGDKHPTDLAGLRGARLVLAAETEQGRAWDERRISLMTGGDAIPARFMRQDFFEYVPEYKPIIFGNYKPTLRNASDASRRRLQMVPFSWKPTAEERIKDFDQQLVAEWPAILRWLIDGCLKWLSDGIQPPACVLKMTDKYFSDQDIIGRWVDERCETALLNIGDTFARLFGDWRRFAERNGVDPGDTKSFGDSLELIPGVERTRSKVARGFKGIRLRPPEPVRHWQDDTDDGEDG